ncbi:hypothetical protein BH24GEM2_BH24GEM2_07810 [soil metagenome]
MKYWSGHTPLSFGVSQEKEALVRDTTISVKARDCAVLVAFALLCAGCGTGGDSSESRRASTQTKQWFQGATLHNATVGQWKAAAYDNKLATAGDWLSATRWKGHLNTPADFDRLKTKANALVKAIDGSLVSGKQLDSMPVNEVAAALVTMSADFGP